MHGMAFKNLTLLVQYYKYLFLCQHFNIASPLHPQIHTRTHTHAHTHTHAPALVERAPVGVGTNRRLAAGAARFASTAPLAPQPTLGLN